MIATLTGKIAEKIADVVVLDVRGVGYGLLMTGEDYGALGIGQDVKVYVHEHIREQSHDLFGFTSLEGMQLFEQLLGVNGVGPKMALSVLSIGTASQVRAAIAGGDLKFIQAAQGVGKRVAERIVVELKDKVGLEGVALGDVVAFTGSTPAAKDEAVEGLVSLGYTVADAQAALQGIDVALSVEQRITQALKGGF